MTREEEIKLLLEDLSCRVPYGVIVNVEGTHNAQLISVSWYEEVGVDDSSLYLYPISDVKPYLFPLSSMTDCQKGDYQFITERWMYDPSYSISDSIDWLNKNHFDYRGLIESGLAIDATNLNIY